MFTLEVLGEKKVFILGYLVWSTEACGGDEGERKPTDVWQDAGVTRRKEEIGQICLGSL